ncbi:MAG TPA: efflux RND transporter periplasmic adaptor subunit, partial [Rhizomicrobium sp.]|nr:efflux RND transporter periplasmic adaptor subunit [Rhizomicrobium sp.]
MSNEDRNRWLAAAMIGIVAGGAGFGIARLTAPVPQSESASENPSTPSHLKLADDQIVAAGILVEKVSAGNLGAEVLAPAVVAAEPSGVASLTAHAEGVVSRLNKRLGDPVRAGEVLALVDSKDAARLASDRASAEANAGLARRVAEQEEALFRQGATSQRSLQTAQASLAAAEADARRARDAAVTANLARDGHSVEIVSPLSGRITAQKVALGAFVQTETELFRVADPRFIQIEAQLTAADAAKVVPGDGAVLMLPDGSTAKTTVRSVTPALDPETRTQTVIISVPAGLRLAPGETLQARIAPKGTTGNGIIVSESAIQSLDGQDSVFLRTADGFDVRHVSVGTRGAGLASIIAGINPGDSIATRN